MSPTTDISGTAVEEGFKRGPGRPRTVKPTEGPAIPGISILDLENEFDPETTDSEKQAFSPFAGYPIRLITARFYKRDPRLDQMNKDELIQVCIDNEFIHKDWKVRRAIPKEEGDKHTKVMGINTDWDADRVRAYIDRRQTHTFPSHYLVFTNVPSRKAGMPYQIALKSWITRRFRSVWFDMQWPMPTPDDPYLEGKKNQCAIVDDDSVRAQLMYERQVKTGKIIRRRDGNKMSFFLLKQDQTNSIQILRKIFENGTKGSADLQRWAKEEGGLPDA